MLIKVSDPVFQTILFSIIFCGLLLVFIRKKGSGVLLSKEVTNQLKGFAILTIVFSHIGYFLSSDNKFLYPYSILAGVGVNLFLLLSGFGLTISHLKSPLSPLAFYKKRLLRLFIPMWFIITIFLIMDFFLLNRSYPMLEIIRGFLGFYPKANLYINFDSPLWYFSVILFYYLIFPLIFVKKFHWISPLLVLLVSILALNLELPIDNGLIEIYKVHTLAFPLGMLLGLAILHIKFKLNKFLKLLILSMTAVVFLYTSVHSGVGEDPKIEQGISLITTLSVVLIFTLSRFNFKLFSLFGIYSYEIYLLHWPILSRYNLFIGLPPFLEVTLNIALILILGYILQTIIRKFTKD